MNYFPVDLMSEPLEFFNLNSHLVPFGLFLLKETYLEDCIGITNIDKVNYISTLCIYTTDRFNYLCTGLVMIEDLEFDIGVIHNCLERGRRKFITITYKHSNGWHITGYANFGDCIYRLESSLHDFTQRYTLLSHQEAIDEIDELSYYFSKLCYTVVDIPNIKVAERNLISAIGTQLSESNMEIRKILLRYIII